ncbi:serine-protein kinase ATM-like [Oncorhynchus keta]|uniref:serine-protein kinase ATM-like n=1 Tax=Oncorhynchus keta TaxID=8018 RepID=UPI0015FD44B5|nr:serine-protein kinase ATM-like [Oncorhynchus keta]
MVLYLHSQPFIVCDDMFHVLSRELDPAPIPPSFSSNVIKATLDYFSKCHSASHQSSLVAILSRTLISIQRILLAVCQKAAETINAYERIPGQ